MWLDAVEVLDAEGAGTGQCDLMVMARLPYREFSEDSRVGRTHRRVRGGHMVEAVRDAGACAAGRVGHRAARDQPHHELDAFAAGLAHVVDVRHLRQAGGVGDQAVEEARCPTRG
jgi:hypothetical protein